MIVVGDFFHSHANSELDWFKKWRADFEEFDYVLAMDSSNLAALERLRPAESPAEVAMFLEHAPATDTDDVPDPYHGGVEDFDRVVDLSESGARGWLRALTGRK